MKQIALISGCVCIFIACSGQPKNTMSMDVEVPSGAAMAEATLGAGCFWCVEAVFQELKGVYKVESGYTGGSVENPTYSDVTSGLSGHAEVARITYDPNVLSFEFLLSVFFQTHDPTTLNRQGADVGTQYRSEIFFHDQAQKEAAEKIILEVNKSGAYDNPIVTKISPLGNYYPAEGYHQDYYLNNPNQGYCTYVIAPKLEKFRKVFKDYLN